MNTPRSNRIVRCLYLFFSYSKFMFLFIWVLRIIINRAPGGDDGGGGL